MDEKKFIELYERQKESRLTVREFCSNEVITPSTFYYWQKKLKNRQRLPGFIPVVINSSPAISPCGLSNDPLSTMDSHNKEAPPIEIEFPNKTIIRIKSELDLSVLKALIHLND